MAALRNPKDSIMNAQQLAKPDNSADVTIMLAISGNRLVSVLNALDALAFGAKRYRMEGNRTVADCEYYAEIRATTEAVRDELSRQRSSIRDSVHETGRVAQAADEHLSASCIAHGFKSRWDVRPHDLPTRPALAAAFDAKYAADRANHAAWDASLACDSLIRQLPD